MLLVGLTGGLASGKSTVAALLEERGAVVVDADELSRRAIEPDTPGFARVVEAFGPGVVGPGGAIDRAALAERVFHDEALRRVLEEIVHPEVFRLLGEEVTRRRGTDRVVVFDAPLIFETGFDAACDLVVVVDADEDEQVRRASSRGMKEAHARARIAAQMPADERRARAGVVLDNRGGVEDLERRVEELWRELERRARQDRPI